MMEGSPHVNSLPSDFADVQPSSYDPQFISQISNKMQVPDSIRAVQGVHGVEEYKPYTLPSQMAAVSMQVPERISLDDEMQGRHKLDKFDFSNKESNMNYVGLTTPPRTLTMEEAFAEHVIAEDMEEIRNKSMNSSLPNGHTHAPIPYTPGASMSDSLLHNEDDDATQLRTQVAKLTRRVTTLEQDNQRRSTRELVLYPLVMGMLLSKIFSWLFRSRN